MLDLVIKQSKHCGKDFLYKVWASGIIKRDRYYKAGQILLQSGHRL